MGHIPYGYTIDNGEVVIERKASEGVKKLFSAYLDGLSLTEAAKMAGIKKQHTCISRLLADEKYTGDGYYPRIIDSELFIKVQLERQRRMQMRVRVPTEKPQIAKPKSLGFSMPAISQVYTDHFKQAEYAYSLIESVGDTK